MKPVRVPPGLFVEIEPETDSEGRERRGGGTRADLSWGGDK